MSKFAIKVTKPFLDAEDNNVLIKQGALFETKSFDRVKRIVRLGLGQLIRAEHGKKGKRILIHQEWLYRIGGIETANQHIARAFKDSNIAFIFNKADQWQVLELARFQDVILDDRIRKYEADVLILQNYHSAAVILNRVKAKKVYQFIHGDLENLTKMKAQKNFKMNLDKRIDAYLSVSKEAQRGLKNKFGIESKVLPNILNPIDEKPLVFCMLTRATEEKGIDRVIEFAKRLDEAGKDFVIFLSSTIEQLPKSQQLEIQNNSRFVTVKPSVYSRELLRAADYLIQLSRNEAYCYSVREALQMKVPVIASRIPVFEKLIKEGENGYILDDDFENLDIDKIFENIPKPKAYSEKIDSNWSKLMKGEL